MLASLAANSPINEQTMWWIVAVGGAGVLYLLMRPKGKRPDPLGAPKFSLSRQRDVEQQMQNLLVELSSMARQITAQLDTRAARLELLLKEADERLAELRTAMPGNGEPNPLPSLPPVVEMNPEPIATAAEEPMALPVVTPQPSENRHAEVYRLADQGIEANEIARAVNRPTGEVELILALRPK